MERIVLDRTIDTDYGQFDLVWGDSHGFDGDFERFYAGQSNGLVGAASGEGVHVNLARRSGGSPVRIVLLDDAPAVDVDHWEDIVEVSFTVPDGVRSRWSTWANEDSGPLDLAAGTYRLRTSARGRDAGSEGEFSEEAVDAYLLEIWPARLTSDSVVRSTSADAAYWHDEIAQRR